MEFIGGGDLNEYLKHHNYMREDKVQEVSRQVLRGIEYVHGMGISHRDLKPDNILMVSEDPLIVKISDFGLAKMVQSEETFLKTFCGTMLYLAPEVYPGYATALLAGANSVKRKRNPREDAGREDGKSDRQKKRYNQAVDMWSFGCVIHMLLTGKPAFAGQNADDMLKLILKGYTDTSALEKTLGRGCHDAKDFLKRLLQVNPAMRMHEQEALRHDWLKNGSDLSSSSMEQDEDEDEDEEEISHEAQRGDNMLMSNELDNDDEYHIVDGAMDEKWQKVPSSAVYHWVDSVRKSSNEEPDTPKPEDPLLGAVRRMSFDQFGGKMSTSQDESVNDSFRSMDAESNASGSKMFRKPDISIQKGSDPFLDAGYSMYSGGSVALPNGVPSSQPFQFDSRAEFQFASSPVASSNPRGSRALARSISDGSLAAAEMMVGKLKVASPSPRGTPSPKANEFSGRQQNGDNVEVSNISSFNDPAVVYSTPLSLMAPRDTAPPTPKQGRRSSNPENHAPLSQPCNVQAEAANFARPNTPWGRLIPINGSGTSTIISLNKQMVVIGRSPTCTHILQDIRISKTHFAIQLADPELRVQPTDVTIWHPKGNMIAWFKVAGTNGCFLNGRKKRKGSIGRIFDGDVIHLFKEEKDGQNEYIAFKCELKIGIHRRHEMEISDEDMSVKQKADVKAHGVSMGISMATTMAIASPSSRQDENFVDEV